jgi:hypothetical protein
MTSIEAFFCATDLDELLESRRRLGTLSSAERQQVLQVLKAWSPAQAVANILLHSEIIPPEHRFPYVQRALDDARHPYFALAATVGLTGQLVDMITQSQRASILDRLVAIMKNDNGVLAERASLSVSLLVSDHNVKQVLECFANNNETVRQNVLAHAVKHFGRNCDPQLFDAIVAANLPPDAKQIALDRANRHVACVTGGRNSPTSQVLIAYVPNLSEVVESQADPDTRGSTHGPPA